MAKSIETRCLHADTESVTDCHYGAISYPIYQTATFAHKGVGEGTGYDYSRMQNPTRQALEETVARIENGIDAMAFSTGMAAITLLMELFSPGDHLIVESDLYGGSIRLFDHISEKNGLTFTYANCSKDPVEEKILPQTRAIFLESPTNPMMRVTDICAISDIARRHGLLLIVDNTFLTPYFLNPLSLGADIVVHSGTKYLGGHNDTLAGFLVTDREDLSERLRFLYKTTGACLSPFDSWLILRGIKTLAVRMDRAQENAMEISRWLLKQALVEDVRYPGLETHPGHDILKAQARGFGAMVTFSVRSGTAARAVLKHVRLICFAESLGGTETLITYPITQTHADVAPEMLAENGITECTLRLSVGIEGVRDLIEDLAQAFAAAEEEEA